jgi:hypothetical protein
VVANGKRIAGGRFPLGLPSRRNQRGKFHENGYFSMPAEKKRRSVPEGSTENWAGGRLFWVCGQVLTLGKRKLRIL